MALDLRIAGFAAIVSVLMIVPIFFATFFKSAVGNLLRPMVLGSFFLGSAAALVVLYGYVAIGDRFESLPLKIVAFVSMLSVVADVVFSIFVLIKDTPMLLINNTLSIVTVAIGVAMGVLVLLLKNKIGNLALALGLLFFAESAAKVAGMFVMDIAFVFSFWIGLVEIMMFFNLAKEDAPPEDALSKPFAEAKPEAASEEPAKPQLVQ